MASKCRVEKLRRGKMQGKDKNNELVRQIQVKIIQNGNKTNIKVHLCSSNTNQNHRSIDTFDYHKVF